MKGKKKKKDLFSRIAPKYDKLIGTFAFDELKEFIPLDNNEILLEIGGGTGRAAQELNKYVQGTIVFDSSFEMVSEVNKKNSLLFPVQGFAETLPFKEGSFSQILLNDTLHHIKRQEETISESYKVLKKNGKLMIRDYDRKYFWNILLIIFEMVLLFHSKFLTPNELEDMCKEANYSSIEVKRPGKATYILIATK